MNAFWTYVSDGSHWSGEDGVPHRLLEHLGYSFGALVFVILIGLPLGLYVGHTGRGATGTAGWLARPGCWPGGRCPAC